MPRGPRALLLPWKAGLLDGVVTSTRFPEKVPTSCSRRRHGSHSTSSAQKFRSLRSRASKTASRMHEAGGSGVGWGAPRGPSLLLLGWSAASILLLGPGSLRPSRLVPGDTAWGATPPAGGRGATQTGEPAPRGRSVPRPAPRQPGGSPESEDLLHWCASPWGTQPVTFPRGTPMLSDRHRREGPLACRDVLCWNQCLPSLSPRPPGSAAGTPTGTPVCSGPSGWGRSSPRGQTGAGGGALSLHLPDPALPAGAALPSPPPGEGVVPTAELAGRTALRPTDAPPPVQGAAGGTGTSAAPKLRRGSVTTVTLIANLSSEFHYSCKFSLQEGSRLTTYKKLISKNPVKM